MKKFFVLMLAVLMLTFSAVCAQETVTELPDLTFNTVGAIFSWGNKAEDVYNFLSQYEGLTIEIDSENSIIFASAESEKESFMYSFFFDMDTDELWSLDCYATIADDIDPVEVLNSLIETYNLQNVERYEADESITEYVADFEASAAAADENTIYVLAASSATEENDAEIGLYFYDRKYYEGE